MVEYEVGKIKLGGLFSKSVKVLFEIKYEYDSMEGEVKSITMRGEDGRELGKIEYAIKDKKSKITTFVIWDWSTDAYAIALLKRYIEHVKKDGAKIIEGEIYDKDATTYNQLNALKKTGFKIQNMGKLTGYQQYYITKKV